MSFLSDSDTCALNELVNILAPIKEATLALCDEKGPTVPVIAPMLSCLMTALSVNETNSSIVSDLKGTVRSDVQQRYSDQSVKDILQISVALDPHFKYTSFLDADEKESSECIYSQGSRASKIDAPYAHKRFFHPQRYLPLIY